MQALQLIRIIMAKQKSEIPVADKYVSRRVDIRSTLVQIQYPEPIRTLYIVFRYRGTKFTALTPKHVNPCPVHEYGREIFGDFIAVDLEIGDKRRLVTYDRQAVLRRGSGEL